MQFRAAGGQEELPCDACEFDEEDAAAGESLGFVSWMLGGAEIGLS